MLKYQWNHQILSIYQMDKGALQMYNENDFLNCGGFPYQDDSCRIVCIVKELFEEKDIPIRPVLQESIKELR